jgi:hypothetical protein
MSTTRSTKATGKSTAAKPRARQENPPAEPTQLRLLDGGRTKPRSWQQLDARTRRIGRERVAEAREILRRAQPPQPFAPHDKIAG